MTRVHARRLVQEISRRPPRLARAYLAETYDGIGQHVKLTMSRGAITSAFRARIAAGDFGAGRTFPPGTPVVIFSNRGQLEVFLGNIPGGVWDPFSREQVGTLGDAPSGDTYQISTDLGFVIPSVDGSEAVIPFTTTNRLAYFYFDATVAPLPDVMKLNSFIFRAKFKQNQIFAFPPSDFISFNWYKPGLGLGLSFGGFVTNASGVSDMRVDTQLNGSHITIPRYEPDTWYIWELDYARNDHVKASVYKEDDGPPASPMVNFIPEDFDLSSSPLWDWSQELSSGKVLERRWDYLDFIPT